MSFVFTSIFKASAIVANLNAAIERDAANGRVNVTFRNLLADNYGVSLPAAPVAFANAVNAMRAAPTMERFDQRGEGAIKGAKQVHEALAAMVTAIVDAGKVANMPALSDVPAWLAPKPAKAKAEKAETVAKAEKAETVATATPEGAASATPTPTVADSADQHIIAVIALAKAGALTADQKGALLQALEGCAVVNAPMPKRARKAKPEAATA